jgi:hypothetical protein
MESLSCPRVVLLPESYQEPGTEQDIAFRDFNALAAGFDSFDALATNTEFPSYDALMVGHPGYPGGPPILPTGTGVTWGVRDEHAEWWITDAEGLDDSPEWVASTVEPAVGSGTWLDNVRARGREVVLRGHIIGVGDTEAEQVANLRQAKIKAAAALAVPPHTGRLWYDGRELSVAMAGRTRVRHVGTVGADIEMTLRGFDSGTAGVGAFFEGERTSMSFQWGVTESFVVGGSVPTPPVIYVAGPVPSSTLIDVGDVTITLAGDVEAGEVLTIDCRNRRSLLNGKPRRDLISLSAWPLLTVGTNTLKATRGSTGTSGRITVTATELF